MIGNSHLKFYFSRNFFSFSKNKFVSASLLGFYLGTIKDDNISESSTFMSKSNFSNLLFSFLLNQPSYFLLRALWRLSESSQI